MLSFQWFSLIFENGPILASMAEQNHELKNRSTFSPSFPQIIPKIFLKKPKSKEILEIKTVDQNHQTNNTFLCKNVLLSDVFLGNIKVF